MRFGHIVHWVTNHPLLLGRAQEGGSRPSVSALLVEIVEARREELVKEAGPYLG